MTTLSFDYKIETMPDLFKRARKEGKWFYTKSEDIWFSPDELEKQQNEKQKYMWDAPSWQLRKPDERIDEIEKQMGWLKTQLASFKKRMAD